MMKTTLLILAMLCATCAVRADMTVRPDGWTLVRQEWWGVQCSPEHAMLDCTVSGGGTLREIRDSVALRVRLVGVPSSSVTYSLGELNEVGERVLVVTYQ